MSWHRSRHVLLLSAAMLVGCASQWEKEQAEIAARAAAGPSAMGDPSSCPKLSLGTIVLDPCCTADNQCGGDGTKLGYGCSSLADPMFRSFVSNPPEPRACTVANGAAGSGGSPPLRAPQPPAAGAAAPPPSTTPAGTADASKCPSVMAFGMTINACCTQQNHCGADGSAMGFGCTDLGDAMFRMIAGGSVPPAQTCDGAPL